MTGQFFWEFYCDDIYIYNILFNSAIGESDLPPEAKKIKDEPKDEVDKAEEAKEDKKYTKQMKIYYKYRDALKAFPKSDVQNLLKSNNQQPLEGISEVSKCVV